MKKLYLRTLIVCLLALAASGLAQAQNVLLVNTSSLTFEAPANGAAPAARTVSISNSAGGTIAYSAAAATTSGGAWLTVSPAVGNTPANLTVTANQGSLQPGNYIGSVTITAPAASNSPVTIPVTLVVTNNSPLTPTPSSLSFSYTTGSAAPAAQTLAVVGTTAGTVYTASSSATWLSATVAGPTPSNTTVSVNPAGLAPGTHTGNVTLTPTNPAGNPFIVPVTFTVSAAPTVTVSPSSLTFNFQLGTAAPNAQQIVVGSTTPTPLNFTVGVAMSVGAGWLTATPTAAATPATLTVSVNPTGLAEGLYTGSVTITAPGASNASVTVPVTFRVSAQPLINLSASSISFSSQIGAADPTAQSVTVSSTGTQISYTVSKTGGDWLLVGPLSGNTPSSITLSVNSTGLPPGTYESTLSIVGAGAGNSPVSLPVRLTVTNSSLLTTNLTRLAFPFQIGRTPPAAQNLQIGTTAGPLSFTAEAVPVSGGPWLQVTPASGTAPATAAISVNPTGLTPGTYTGNIVLTSAGAANSPLSVPVTLVVSNSALLSVNTNLLTYTYQLGSGNQPPFQQIAVSSTGDQIAFETSSTQPAWLAPASGGFTPRPIDVGVSPLLLSAGTYDGAIRITSATAANSPLEVPVRLQVVTGTLTAAPASLSFTQVSGGPAPAAQAIAVTATGATLNFAASAGTVTGGNWLAVTPGNSATPGNLSVSVNAGSLAPGSYSGAITVVSPGAAGSPRTIPVTLTVTPAPTITANPASMTFNVQAGAAAPPAQTLAIATGTSNFPVGVVTNTSWLQIGPSTGQTPVSVQISVNPAGLTPGQYSGSVVITVAGASNSPLTVPVSLTVAQPPTPTGIVLTNNASFAPGAVAPGQIISVFGSNIGPATQVTAEAVNGFFPRELGGVRVTFDGIAAVILSAGPGTGTPFINAIVPYEIAGRTTTQVVVENRGVASAPITVQVAASAPGIYTVNASQGLFINQDFSFNGPSNPAARGSIVIFYATGEGQTAPIGVTGRVTNETTLETLRRPVGEVRVTVGGRPAEVLYAGAAPGFVAGLMQVNVRIPEDVNPGQQAVVIQVGAGTSQPNANISLR